MAKESQMSRNVLVTGGAGFIGSSVADALVARGDRVTIFDNFAAFYSRADKERNVAPALARGARLIEGDVTDAAQVRAAIHAASPDAIIHLAACAGVRPSIANPSHYAHVNVTGTGVVLDEAVRGGFGEDHGRIVVASSSSVYGNNPKTPFAEDDDVSNPISPYAATKVATEMLCKTAAHLHGCTITALRFFTVFGPRQRPDLAISSFMRRISAGDEITLFGDGSTSRDYTAIGDIVDGVLRALDQRGPGLGGRRQGYRCYNLGGDHPITLADLVKEIEEVVGVHARIRRLAPQPGDVERTWADLTRVRDELGFRPAISLRDGLEQQWEWMNGRVSAGTTA